MLGAPKNMRNNLSIMYRGTTLDQKIGMKNQKFVQITVWVVVVSMVLALVVAGISALV